MNIKNNNFNIIRLFAAVQVAYLHIYSHLQLQNPFYDAISKYISAFPGVPIFFIISGFLITASYERNMCLKQYTTNRILRIFPALWVAFLVSIIILYSMDQLHLKDLPEFLTWSFCQLTLFQFYNPPFLRDFGTGVLNGSLWTIPVELQFYILVPVLYFLSKKYANRIARPQFFWLIFLLAVFISLLCNLIPKSVNHIRHFQFNYELISKLINVTLFPYLYCFLIGVLFRLHLNKIYKYINGKFIYYLMAYITLYVLLQNEVSFNKDNPLIMFLLGLCVISGAFSYVHLSHTLLKDTDYSYGIYIYHGLFINIFMAYSLYSSWYLFPIILTCVFLTASLSWRYVEKPALRLKYNPLIKLEQNKKIDAISIIH